MGMFGRRVDVTVGAGTGEAEIQSISFDRVSGAAALGFGDSVFLAIMRPPLLRTTVGHVGRPPLLQSGIRNAGVSHQPPACEHQDPQMTEQQGPRPHHPTQGQTAVEQDQERLQAAKIISSEIQRNIAPSIRNAR
jgi:hypothetical protein